MVWGIHYSMCMLVLSVYVPLLYATFLFYYLQCNADLVDIPDMTIGCCDEADFCNKELEPEFIYYPKPTPGKFSLLNFACWWCFAALLKSHPSNIASTVDGSMSQEQTTQIIILVACVSVLLIVGLTLATIIYRWVCSTAWEYHMCNAATEIDVIDGFRFW